MARSAKAERQAKDASGDPALAVAGGPVDPARPSLARALTPNILLDSTPAEWLMKQPAQRRHLLLLAAFGALIFFPYLGAVGFWDPWEVHYGEVARSMIVRQDYVHPYWESAYFFSKPVGSLWMMVVGQLIAGVNDPARGTAVYTEWCVRSIFAAVAIGGLLMIYMGVSRTISRRAGIWAAVIMATSPIYFLLARQTVPDMPFVCYCSASIACLMIALFEKERVQDGWLVAFYALMGVAVLTKEFLGIILPGGAMLLYLLLSGDWHLLARLRLIMGTAIVLLVAGPWITVMSFFPGKDDESNSFAYRFFIHDQFKRAGVDPTRMELVGGVHTTTPNTTFVYYIEQLGFGLFPWMAALPGALARILSRTGLTSAKTRREKAQLFVIAWTISSFVLFAFVATKFHHYDFPVVPPLAILMGLFIEDVLEEGVAKFAVPLLVGLALFGMVAQNLAMEPKHLTDLFVYNYERPYPKKEVDEAILFSLGRTNVTSQMVFIAIFVAGPVMSLLGVTEIRRWFRAATAKWIPSNRGPISEEPADRLYIVGAITLVAVCFAVFVSSYHWRKLSVHWTQRDLFWEYTHESDPSEPVAAYQMNWRGETFYSRNLVRQLKEVGELRDFIAQPGRQWVLVEQGRLAGMKSSIGSGYDVRVVDKSNNKFALVVVAKSSGSPSPR
jgi:4-amino-4-deoxy-L-arabinose transferase-like glycosyltransferase